MVSEMQTFSPWHNSAREQAQLRSCALAAPSAAASRYIHQLEDEVSALTQHYNTACHLLHRAILVQDLSCIIIDELEGRGRITDEESTFRGNVAWLCMSIMSVLRRVAPPSDRLAGAAAHSQGGPGPSIELSELPERIVSALRDTLEQGNERVSELVGAVPRRVCTALATEDIRVNSSKHESCAVQNEECRAGLTALQRQLDRVLTRVDDLLSEFNTTRRSLLEVQRDGGCEKAYTVPLQKAVRNVEDLSSQVSEVLRYLQHMQVEKAQQESVPVNPAPQTQLLPTKLTYTATTQTAASPQLFSAETQTPLQPQQAEVKADLSLAKRVNHEEVRTATVETQTACQPLMCTAATQTTPPPSPACVAVGASATQQVKPAVPVPTAVMGTETGNSSPAAEKEVRLMAKSSLDSRVAHEWRSLVEFSFDVLDVLSLNIRDYMLTSERMRRISEDETRLVLHESDMRNARQWELLVSDKVAEIKRLNDEVKRLDANLKNAERLRGPRSTDAARSDDNDTPSLAQLYAAYSSPFIPPKVRAIKKAKLFPVAELWRYAVRYGARPALEEGDVGGRVGGGTPQGKNGNGGRSDVGSAGSRQGSTPNAGVTKRPSVNAPAENCSRSTPNKTTNFDAPSLAESCESTAFIAPAVAVSPEKRARDALDDTPEVTPRPVPAANVSDPGRKLSSPASIARRFSSEAIKESPKATAPPSTSAVSIGGGVVTVRKFKRSLSSLSSSGNADTAVPKRSEGGGKGSSGSKESEKKKGASGDLGIRKLKRPLSSDSLSVSLSDVPVRRKADAKGTPERKPAVANNSFDESTDSELPKATRAVSKPAKSNETTKETPKDRKQGKQRERRWSESSSSWDQKKGATTAAKNSVAKGAAASSDSSLTLTL